LTFENNLSVAEREVLQDAIRIGLVDHRHSAQGAPALRIFRGEQVAFARVRAQYLAARGDFEALGHRPSLSYCLWDDA